MKNIASIHSILLVLLGGLFGWCLGKLPDKLVFMVIAIAIMLLILVLKNVTG